MQRQQSNALFLRPKQVILLHERSHTQLVRESPLIKYSVILVVPHNDAAYNQL